MHLLMNDGGKISFPKNDSNKTIAASQNKVSFLKIYRTNSNFEKEKGEENIFLVQDQIKKGEEKIFLVQR